MDTRKKSKIRFDPSYELWEMDNQLGSNQRRWLTPSLAVCCAAVAAAVLAAAFASGGGTAPESPYGAGAVITIDNFDFSAVVVSARATVQVVNADGAPHTVTADGGEFTSGIVSGGGRGSFVAPSAPGSYPFHCEVHPSMTGTLEVR